MKTLYIECNMGAAGDMLTAALLELLPESEQDIFVEALNHIHIPDVKIARNKMESCGIVGSHMEVKIHDEEEESIDSHEHTHDHHHDHDHDHHDHDHHDHNHHDHHHSQHHASMDDIMHIIQQLEVSGKVKNDIGVIYQIIAKAESKAHGRDVSEIHFHEVGMMDAIADITAVCMLMEKIAPERIVVSPIHVGYGHVRCAHGMVPVPAPATAYILEGVPYSAGDIEGELCTPTGAALLTHFATEYATMPRMKVEKIGYGIGKKKFVAANCVRAFLGETTDARDELVELRCNVDDMTGEEAGFLMDQVMKVGALDVYTIPIGMKKSRPGLMITVMCKESQKEEIYRLIFLHTTTLGIREYKCERRVLERSEHIVSLEQGDVRVKVSKGYGICKSKAEYEDVIAISEKTGMSIAQIKRMVSKIDEI